MIENFTDDEVEQALELLACKLVDYITEDKVVVIYKNGFPYFELKSDVEDYFNKVWC